MSLNDTVNQGIVDFGLLHQIIHGDATQQVTTEGGPVQTVANVVNNILGHVLVAMSATSTTSIAIDSSDKVFSITTGKAFQSGHQVIASAGPDNSITGTVVSYVGATLTIRPIVVKGTGTFNSWNIVFTGAVGQQGTVGQDGLSAYDIAVNQGFSGSQTDWVASLVGTAGKNAYEVAKDAGYTGTAQDWLTSLTGAAGPAGKSAFELVQDTGFTGSMTDWLTSLRGERGDKGNDGAPGSSAYVLALGYGFNGTESEWLDSLKGTPGTPGTDGTNGTPGKSAFELATEQGYQGTLQDWLATLKGQDGTSIIIKGQLADSASLPAGDPTGSAYVVSGDVWIKGDAGWFDGGPFLGIAGAAGRSAYQIALDNGFVGNETTWLASLVGPQGTKGDTGAPGQSSYDLAVLNGFVGTPIDWLNSLRGPAGPAGGGGGGGSVAEVPIPDSGVINPNSLDATLGNVFTITVTGNLTLPPVVNPVSGQTYLIVLMQDQGGNHTVALDKKYKFGNNVAPTPSTAGSAIDIMEATYSSTGFFFCTYRNGYSITAIARILTARYDTVAAATAALQDGDTIYITRSGQMSECVGSIYADINYTIAGDPAVNGTPKLHVDSTVRLAGQKAIINPESGHALIRDIQLDGASSADHSGAGVRINPGPEKVRLERVTLTNNENGMLTSAPSAANKLTSGYNIEIVDCVFDHNGTYNDGQGHNIYLGHDQRAYVLRSRFTNAGYGHDFKTRASYVVLDRVYCSGAGSREMDVPNGGVIHAVNSSFVMGPKTGQNNLIGIGLEGIINSPQEYIFRNCLLSNTSGGNFSETFVMKKNGSGPDESVPVKFVDCVFITNSTHCIMDTPFELYYTSGPIGPEGWDQSNRGIIPKRGTYDPNGGNQPLADNLQPVPVNGPDPTLGVFPPTGSTSTVSVRPESQGPDVTPPAITLSASSTIVSNSGTISLIANATDNIGVAFVDYFREGTKIGTTNSSPHTWPVTLTSSDNGDVHFTANAVDAAGNITTSNTVTVTVNVLPPPTVYTFSMDNTTTNEYNTAIANAALGSKRIAGANAISNAMTTTYRLYIYQESTLVLPMQFTAPMVVADDGTNVSVSTATPESTDPLVAADITAGTWHFELQGGGGYTRLIKGSVGPVGSGKMIEISDNPSPGTGMTVSFSMIVPRSVDGLS